MNGAYADPKRSTLSRAGASNGDAPICKELAVIPGGLKPDGNAGTTPLAESIRTGNWSVAKRLIDCGCRPTQLWEAAGMGMRFEVLEFFPDWARPEQDQIDAAFWHACRGGRVVVAIFLFDQGADVNRVPAWAPLTPLDAAYLGGRGELIDWLSAHGATSCGG